MKETLPDVDPRARKAGEFVVLLLLVSFGAGIGGSGGATAALLVLPALVVLGGLIYLFG